MNYQRLISTLLFCLIVIQVPKAYAIPPPDVLFQVGTSVWHIFSVIIVGIVMLSSFLKTHAIWLMRVFFRKGLVFPLVILLLVNAMFFMAFSYPNQDFESANLVDRWPESELSLTVQQFKDLYEDSADDVLIVDVREDEEREVGFLPGTFHVRKADVMNGNGKDFSGYRLVVFVCYSGSRARRVAEYVSDLGIQSAFLQGGLKNWVSSGGSWNGDFSLSHLKEGSGKFQELSVHDLERAVQTGAVLVDSRRKNHFDGWHIEGSVSLPVFFTSSSEISELLAQVPENADVVVMCDGIAQSCFSAMMTGIKLEHRGHRVLGMFTDLQVLKRPI